MEKAAGTGIVAFDKTGTLTEGTPRLATIRVMPRCGHDRAGHPRTGRSGREPVRAPARPCSSRRAADEGLALERTTEFTARPAANHRRRCRLPRRDRQPAHLPPEAGSEADKVVADLEEDGQTAAVMRIDGRPVAVLGIADRIRPAAAAAAARITQLTGTAPVLLTGDNRRAAVRLAAQAGIGDVRASLLPEDKVRAVRELEAAGRHVLLAGNGVNDAPALAAASTGIAMGRGGSDLTLDTANIVIMRDDLTAIPAIIALSRRARRVVTANLVIAAVIIAGLVSWDLAGHLPLPSASSATKDQPS